MGFDGIKATAASHEVGAIAFGTNIVGVEPQKCQCRGGDAFDVEGATLCGHADIAQIRIT